VSPIFYIKNGNLAFGEKIILEEAECYIENGDKIALVGENGSGKSTLMRLIFGEYELDSGDIFRLPSVSLGYLKQEVDIVRNISVLEFILEKLKDPNDEYKAKILLNELSLDENLMLSKMSGGQIKRLLLVSTLSNNPDILLLDEPTNHLDIKSIEWLERYIKNYNGAVISISHDRTFQFNITNNVWWIDRGTLRICNNGFKYYETWKEEIINKEEEYLNKLNDKLIGEKKWLNTGVTGRRKRNHKRLERIKQLKGEIARNKMKLESAKNKYNVDVDTLVKKNNFIIRLNNVSVKYDSKYIINNFSIKVKKGEKIGIIGPNASGKSTLLKLIAQEITPTCGEIKYGLGTDTAYFDQNREVINQKETIIATMCPTGGEYVRVCGKHIHVAAYLKKFMFDPKLLYNKVNSLSGGQVSRLLLAKILVEPGNLLVLDEPTNDLDTDTIELLLDILQKYQGTLFIVSHDRSFLEQLVTRTLVFEEGADKIIDFNCKYQDYKRNMVSIAKLTVNQKKDSKLFDNSSDINVENKKLSYKYKIRLDSLPGEIEQLEKEIKEMEDILYEGKIYEESPQKAANYGEKIVLLKLELDSKMEEWLSIEQMLE
jgi:ABC transport system ATP-binding/permease protein